MAGRSETAGGRNVRVWFERNVPLTSQDGQQVAQWSRQFRRWAKVLSRTGRERRVFEQVRAEVDFVVRVPCDGETRTIRPADWRIVWSDAGAGGSERTLNIGVCFDVDSRRRTIEMQCTEVVI